MSYVCTSPDKFAVPSENFVRNNIIAWTMFYNAANYLFTPA
jgi:hypothetical protein